MWGKSLTCPLCCRAVAWGAEPKCCFKVLVKVMSTRNRAAMNPTPICKTENPAHSPTLPPFSFPFFFHLATLFLSLPQEYCPGVHGDTLTPPGFFNQLWDFYQQNKARLCMYPYTIKPQNKFSHVCISKVSENTYFHPSWLNIGQKAQSCGLACSSAQDWIPLSFYSSPLKEKISTPFNSSLCDNTL